MFHLPGTAHRLRQTVHLTVKQLSVWSTGKGREVAPAGVGHVGYGQPGKNKSIRCSNMLQLNVAFQVQ